MEGPVFLILTTLLLCMAPGTTCLSADSESPAAEKWESAGSKSAALADNPFERRQFGRSDYMDRPFCKNFVAGGEVEFHSAFYAGAWAFTYWLNKNRPDAYRRYAAAVLNTKVSGDAETSLDAFAIRPVRPLPDIKISVGPDNRDVAVNQSKAVACLDKRIAILRQTPEIQEMHRQ